MNLEQLKILTPKQLKQVKELNLSDKKLTKEDIEFLSEIASSLQSLELIDCRHIKLKDKHFPRLFTLFSLCPVVSYIRMDSNKLHDSSIAALVKILPTFRSLVSLDLSDNKIKELSEESIAQITVALQETPSLIHLDFGNVRMNDDGAAIKASLDNNVLLGKTLLEAVNKNDMATVRDLLKRGANINVLSYIGSTNTLQSPIHIASINGNAAMVRYLLRHGSRPTMTNALGRTPADVVQLELKKMDSDHPKAASLREVLTLLKGGLMLKRGSMAALPRRKQSEINSISSSKAKLFSPVEPTTNSGKDGTLTPSVPSSSS